MGSEPIELVNDHCISQAGLATGAGSTKELTNLSQSPAAARAQGYGPQTAFAYAPGSKTAGTVGTGTNLGSRCAGPLVPLWRRHRLRSRLRPCDR